MLVCVPLTLCPSTSTRALESTDRAKIVLFFNLLIANGDAEVTVSHVERNYREFTVLGVTVAGSEGLAGGTVGAREWPPHEQIFRREMEFLASPNTLSKSL